MLPYIALTYKIYSNGSNVVVCEIISLHVYSIIRGMYEGGTGKHVCVCVCVCVYRGRVVGHGGRSDDQVYMPTVSF